MLASAATASADGAWVLWSHNDFRIEGIPEVTQDKWLVQDSAPNQVQCMARLEQLSVKAAGMRVIDESDTFRVWTSPNLKPEIHQRVRLECFPDTVDPRGPKGK
jgi:hypothetical protein